MAAKPFPLSELHTGRSGSEADTGPVPPPELRSPLQNAGVGWTRVDSDGSLHLKSPI